MSVSQQVMTEPVDCPETRAERPTDQSEATKEIFSSQDVQAFKDAQQYWQTQAQAAQQALEQAQRESQAQLQQCQQALRDRLMQAEIKALAWQSGLMAAEDIKLADLSSLTLTEDGTLEGGEALIADLKAHKPYLFASSSSGIHKAPEPKGTGLESVRTLSPEDYAHRKGAYLNSTRASSRI
jgi:multidrug efflux pump subunit AcrA (membrane-fusion protein)